MAKASEEAVSPLMGVLLMVTITVVVGVVLLTVVGGIGTDTPRQAPSMVVAQDPTARTLTVVNAEPGGWEGVRILIAPGSGAACTGTDASGTVLAAVGTAHAGTPKPILAGDRITLTAVPGQSCEVKLSHAPTNQLLGAWTFRF
jgi:FlaG/FlaF family flagellin (archaellin)